MVVSNIKIYLNLIYQTNGELTFKNVSVTGAEGMTLIELYHVGNFKFPAKIVDSYFTDVRSVIVADRGFLQMTNVTCNRSKP